MLRLIAGRSYTMLIATTLAMLFLGVASPLLACTCVSSVDPAHPETGDQMLMRTSSVIFRGVVVGKKKLSSPEGLRGSVYAVTYRVEEYWKGSPARELIIYGMADVFPGRCEGWGDVSVGEEYLIYAFESEVQDVFGSAKRTWVEYNDAIPAGTNIMTVGACTPSGKVPSLGIDSVLRKLGQGTRFGQSK